MQTFKDLWGKELRLTDERRDHILSHPEMARMVEAIPRTLADPDTITVSRSDPAVRLYWSLLPELPEDPGNRKVHVRGGKGPGNS